ncbi:hypothetical protein L3081_23500 [Colwellia sp. MSW7]|uniref:Uncharacterized protein n=1 Tax=Colwellia maritima TaxID=2912588 RepID=A0ABS9X6D1_9GAMM|nr:hypothetical protein [Colwellia maritima]MCI2285800.1 hypothetical protein [Colwellia maritima]
MSNIDEFANLNNDDTAPIQPQKIAKLKPLYRQFTSLLLALLLTIMVIVGLTYALFYQHNVQKSTLEANQLIPIAQELQHIKALHKADELMSDLLFAANAENFVELHKELIAINAQLLEQNSTNTALFQQWLNEYKLTEDIVSRLQDSFTRNQQLKQSSIIQLQLMLLSIQPVIDNQLANQSTLFTQLQTEKVSNKVSYTSATAYAKSVQHLNSLQQLKSLLSDVLLSFEQLDMRTSMASFEHLRVKVAQLLLLHKQVKGIEITQGMVDVNQQFDTFEKIVITEQSALTKWQGYIRLAQGYQDDLTAQQQKIRQLMTSPYVYPQANGKNMIHVFLGKFNVQVSDHNIVTTLTATIGFFLYICVFLLWQIRRKIKVSTQRSIDIIKDVIDKPTANTFANCAETYEIIQLVKSSATSSHSELEFQSLSTQLKSTEQRLSEQVEKTEYAIQLNEKYQLDSKTKDQKKLDTELQHYASIEGAILNIIQRHQLTCIKPELITNNHGLNITTQLSLLCQRLAQFRLALTVQSAKSRLELGDINLLTELHAILFNKQQEQLINNNQLVVSFDEQLLNEVKIDFRLFQQLISLFIDISLADRNEAQLLLQVQLLDKSVGRQLVCFSAKVKVKSLKVLPDLVTQLVRSQSTLITASSSVEVFSILLAKQYGGNVVAQLVDEGYQLNFELPLAIASSIAIFDNVTLNNAKVILLSNNGVLAELIEKTVLSAKGKFERLAVIESIEHYLSAKYLNLHKLDVLVISSDMAFSHLDYIKDKLTQLPHSMQPKLMVLQSHNLKYEHFGFYAQAEHILCKDTFIENIIQLLANDEQDNQLFGCEPFVDNQYQPTQLPLLLGVKSPQHYQNLQRLLQWLGFYVQIVSHESRQETFWKTGQYSLLITEFVETAFLEMKNTPKIDIGVFDLSNSMPVVNKSHGVYFEHWHKGRLAKESTLLELVEVLSPWLKLKQGVWSKPQNLGSTIKLQSHDDEHDIESELLASLDDRVITQVADILTGDEQTKIFNFSNYLHNQGSVELALFMLG